jgi:hypothetical protein
MTDAAARSNLTPMAEVQALDALPRGPGQAHRRPEHPTLGQRCRGGSERRHSADGRGGVYFPRVAQSQKTALAWR